MAAFGGGIVFIYFCFFGRIKFTNEKVMKTQHIMSLISSCLIRIRWKSSNLIQKGGSKYRVHQGYGCVWRRYRFCTFCFFCTITCSTVKSFENTTHHVSFFHPVSSESDGKAEIWYKREVLSIGFTKGMAAFGGGILFVFFLQFFCRQKLPPKPRSCQKLEKTNFWIFFTLNFE